MQLQSTFCSLFKIFQALADSEVEEGSSITLKCAVEGTPPPTVTWFREDVKIESSLDFQIEYKNGYATLTIPEAFVDDAGKFTCTATNSAGSKSVSCHLRVKGQYDYDIILIFFKI